MDTKPHLLRRSGRPQAQLTRKALTGEVSFSLVAAASWSISTLKMDIAQLRKLPPASVSEMQLLMETRMKRLGESFVLHRSSALPRILEDHELLKDLCDPNADAKLELGIVEVPEDFYVRYYAKMVLGGGRDQEFQEFEFCGFFEGKQIRKECYLSEASLQVLKTRVLKSGILQMDDGKWPAPTPESRQEIEIKCRQNHVVFATKLHWSLPHIDAGLKCAHVNEMTEFDDLADEIKGFGKSILRLFRVTRSS
eukprot:Skav210263  [mRNA]  locus=scaffold1993:113694:115099:+ [translate_table: standard]